MAPSESGSEAEYNLVLTFEKKRVIFAYADLFSVLNGLGSVISRKMDTTCSGLHVGSGFLKKD